MGPGAWRRVGGQQGSRGAAVLQPLVTGAALAPGGGRQGGHLRFKDSGNRMPSEGSLKLTVKRVRQGNSAQLWAVSLPGPSPSGQT